MSKRLENERFPASDGTRATLLLRLRTGGTEREIAWAEFYDIYSPIIRAYARRKGANADAADDVVQEVLRRFFQAVPKFVYTPSKGRFRGYLKTCTARVFHDLEQSLRQQAEQLHEVADEAAGDEELWEREWRKRRLALALEQVRRRYSRRADSQKTFRAFEMRTLFQREPEAVALELSISVDSVHAANSRVAAAVRQTVEELTDLLD
jgi:RNA polymerase sigma factor (sigma-70 family)